MEALSLEIEHQRYPVSTIDPAQPFADALLECMMMVTDPDMDELTYEYAWRNLSNSNADLGMTPS